MGLGLEPRRPRADDQRVVKKPSEGQDIARRRKQLIWNQEHLAEAAGVGLSTVVNAEKDRPVRPANRRAIEDALAAEEQRRGLGPSLSLVRGTTGPQKGGASDVPASDPDADLNERLANLEALFITGLAEANQLRRDVAKRFADIRKSG